MVNRGLIDATDNIALAVFTLEGNLGSAIYGDQSGDPGRHPHQCQRATAPSVIAARERLDLHGNLLNSEHAPALQRRRPAHWRCISDGQAAPAVKLPDRDQPQRYPSKPRQLTSAERIENLDTHFATEVVRITVTAHREFSFKEHPERYDASEVHYEYSFDDDGV